MSLTPAHPPRDFRLTEIGRIHSQFKQATGMPIQPSRAGNSPGHINWFKYMDNDPLGPGTEPFNRDSTKGLSPHGMNLIQLC